MDSESREQRDREADQRGPFSEDGVDLTLIRWMLSMTPRERLLVLQQHIRSVARLRNARIKS